MEPVDWSLDAWDVGLHAVRGIPLVRRGDDLVAVVCAAASVAGFGWSDGDVVVVAHKIVSKAEGAEVALGEVVPSPRAHELAAATGRDPRLCEVYLQESAEVLGTNGRMVITRHRLGFLCTNAGVDGSNAGPAGEQRVVTLPVDPDASARRLRTGLRARTGRDVAVVVTDSFGLPDRRGAITLAIGLAGIRHLEERESQDLYGRRTHSALMLVDGLAGAAGILMGETDEGTPVVVVRGVRYTRDDAASIRGLLTDGAPEAAPRSRGDAPLAGASAEVLVPGVRAEVRVDATPSEQERAASARGRAAVDVPATPTSDAISPIQDRS